MNMLSAPKMSAPLIPMDRHWRALFSGEFYGARSSKGLHTRMGKTMHYGPLRVQRPFYPEGSDVLHMYLLHPPGGLVGGDELAIQVTACEGAKVLVTTPSAGKLYRNESDMQQGQEVRIKVGESSAVEYLPQENIIFNGAKGALNTRVDIQGDGLFIGWEVTCLGRPEGDALFNEGILKQSLFIYHDDKPLFFDRLLLNAEEGVMQSPVGLQHKNAFATFVINRDLDIATFASLVELQQALNLRLGNELMAVTQKPGILIIRVLGERAEPVKKILETVWALIRPVVHDRDVCTPRIWNT